MLEDPLDDLPNMVGDPPEIEDLRAGRHVRP